MKTCILTYFKPQRKIATEGTANQLSQQSFAFLKVTFTKLILIHNFV